ncbi:MAG: phosphoserine phosphatase RsbU/P [Chloroflexota bacterium]|nr:phosphoserine phosphatase RsbU/P [Chloroflexota bacterium]
MPKPSSERLELLYRISQTINSSLDLTTVLDVLIDESIQATHAERGFLMLYDADKHLTFKTARGMDARTVEASEMKVSRGIVERVAESGQPLLTSNAQVDERLDTRASVKLYGLRSVLCVPILLREQVLGVVYVDNRLQNGIFSQDDLDLLQSLAASAGIAIENARLYQVAVETGRMQRELQVAREVQAGLIPPDTPKLDGWEFAASWKPAHEVSGDFYDFITLPDGGTGLVVADVSDKGMPAAMFMALSRSIIRAVAGRGENPASDMAEANRLIWQDAAEEMFITLFYARIDPAGATLTYVNAGHNPPLFYCAASGELKPLTRTGMAAGVEENSPYQQASLDFAPGDSLLIYTDGIVDTVGEQDSYGEERLRSVYQQNAALNAPHLVAAVEKAVSDFSVNEIPFDDITLLVVKRKA